MRRLSKLQIFFLVVSIGFIFSLSAQASAWEWPKEFTASTTGLGTGTYVQTVGWGSALEEKTGMKFRAMPSNNYSERARAHKQGRAILNVDTITTINVQIQADSNHATRKGGTYETNIFWISRFLPFGFIMTRDSEIKGIYDLKKMKNVKVALFRRSVTSVNQVKGMLAWAGVDEKDVIFVPTTTWGGNSKTVVEGRADIAFSSPISKVTYEIEANPKGIRWLDFPRDDKNGVNRYISKMPGIAFGINQKGVKSARGINMPLNTSYFHARASTDPELIYHVAKWLGENYEFYKDKAKGCEEMNIETMRKALDLARGKNHIPIHPGTIRYLKEKGMWSAEDDAWNEKNKKLIREWVKAYDAAIAAADEKKIEINPKNEVWVDLWKSYKKDLPVFGTSYQ